MRGTNMQERIECFVDECYCVVSESCFCSIDACECNENGTIRLVSGIYAGDSARFQKTGDKLCLVGDDIVIEDIQGIEIEMEEESI
jgi:hypothetical protein